MQQVVMLIEPKRLEPNKENPRLIFHEEELLNLQESIRAQGILVPLTVYQDGSKYFLLDGERRWRCALKLDLSKVPVIVQPKPDRLQNIMMMFAIHNARRDWDPLPTAMKLADLERAFEKRNSRKPKESELAGIASLSRGEIRRLRRLLDLPDVYKKLLLQELERPRSKQLLTVDQVLEATKASESLRKRSIIAEDDESRLSDTLIEKFRNGTIKSTVDPRKLVRIARSVQRGEISVKMAQRAVRKLIEDPNYSIDNAYEETVEQSEFEHSLLVLAERLTARLSDHRSRGYTLTDKLRNAIRDLLATADDLAKG